MSIKGTLETFNLCELLQMLAFNQKQGTLVLAGEAGARAFYLDGGNLTFLREDERHAASTERLARRRGVGAGGALERVLERERAGRGDLATALEKARLLDADGAADLRREAALEQLFEAQLTAVAAFEFAEGEAVQADGAPGTPIQPMLGVEGLLLDLARMLDHWSSVSERIPAASEIYEGTGIAVDLGEEEDAQGDLAAHVVPLIDGYTSLEQIAETCYATTYAVTRIACALLDGGGIRAVPTEDLMLRAEDLLARGEAVRALPLLRRSIERGDAPIEVRVRLAEALEASGEPLAAAAELDTFAALSGDEPAPAVFEALSHALKLRQGDLATAARVCDFYLRRRPWLHEHRAAASQALRDLIHGATSSGRPMDAALRLKGFIDCGDAPSEDLLLLADLFASCGARQEAAAALYERSQELMATDRTTAARQMLRRVLELDPGHADAHRRQSEMEGVRRRRGHRTRVTVTLLLLLAVAGGAGLAWTRYRTTSSTQITTAYAEAQEAVTRAEQESEALIAAFTARAQKAAESGDHDRTLGEEARTLRAQVQELMAGAVPNLDAYAAEIRTAQATGDTAEHERNHESLTQRRHLMSTKAKTVVDEQASRARSAMAAALKAHKEGIFEEARRQLRTARNLAFDDPATLTQADRMLTRVEEYFTAFAAAQTKMRRARDAGDLQAAFAAGVRGVYDLLDSDLTRTLPFPVRATSDPEGAEVWVGERNTGLRTPCVLTYSPFEEHPAVRLRLPGRTPAVVLLPDFRQMRHEPDTAAAWIPAVQGTLPPGPRWSVADEAGPLQALWIGGSVPVVAGRGGRRIYAASPADGSLAAAAKLDPTSDGIRMAGRMHGGLEWQVRGHRTLGIRTSDGHGWEVQTMGRIERAPLLIGARVVLVDELGTLYAFDAQAGTPQWRTELGAPPTQAPRAGGGQVLIGTAQGAVFRIDPELGSATPLGAPARGPALALPLGDGVLVLGGGKDGCRYVAADGRERTLGDAQPRIALAPWVAEGGVAWVEDDGIHWIDRVELRPTHVTGLGDRPAMVGGGAGLVFAAGEDGTVRAAALAEPAKTLWEAPLGGHVQCAPLRLGNAVYLLVDGRLVAVDV